MAPGVGGSLNRGPCEWHRRNTASVSWMQTRLRVTGRDTPCVSVDWLDLRCSGSLSLSNVPSASPLQVSKSALNQPDVAPECPPHPASTSPSPDPAPAPAPPATAPLVGLTADDLLNCNSSLQLRGSLLSLESLTPPSRSSARQALGVTVVRQPGRRGAADQLLEPLLYLQLTQPSALLSCHHRKQRMELSLFDVALRGVASDYKCLGEKRAADWP